MSCGQLFLLGKRADLGDIVLKSAKIYNIYIPEEGIEKILINATDSLSSLA